ncbi:MAG: acyl-CoA dehydrogenase family protein [Alphaproteobacteria bacterium]|nr:acyl-CoA dehydrogenase family protein [Alphaproteobacteria bacterium]
MSPLSPAWVPYHETASHNPADYIAPDASGRNFYDIDPALHHILDLYLPADEREHFRPHLRRLGEVAGTELDALAREAERHPPVLHARDRFGRDEDWIEYHGSYRAMEKIAFCDFGFQAMTNRTGVMGWPDKLSYVSKYAFQYLFVQAEFGLMCPISATDTSAFLINRYADPETHALYFDRMTSQDPAAFLSGTQFMTEKSGGSDVGQIELTAVHQDGQWRLYGEKWFCSHTDGDVALLLARPEGAAAGSRGLALFAMPRVCPDGTRNRYRIARLKEKMGTKSMASGEIIFNGALAHLLGDADKGLKQMMDQVNLSRLSHGVRAAAMMQRCWNEAKAVADNRRAFGKGLMEFPLLRRQLLDVLLPTAQAVSMFAYAAHMMDRAQRGEDAARKQLRIMTPLLKYQTARDNIGVAGAAMETRGGNGYIEDWVNPRLVRDAHIGVLWEGTSNINALDIITRAVAKEEAHRELQEGIREKLDDVPAQVRGRYQTLMDKAVDFAERVAREPESEHLCRKASTALYHATSAALMAWEGATAEAAGKPTNRVALAQLVEDTRLAPQDPFAADDLGRAGALADQALAATA